MILIAAKRKWGLSAGILAICILLLWSPVYHAAFAIRFALSLQKLASGATGRDLSVTETVVRKTSRGQSYEALVYCPSKSPAKRAVILLAGLSELGCRHPRLIAFSRFLADKGLMVITPDVKEFREFQITAKPIDQIVFWHKEVQKLKGGEKIRSTGLAGISFSGTLALIASAKPEIRDKVAFVFALGPYSDLLRCTKYWFADAPGYAKWIVMLSALDLLTESKDRLFLHDALNNLLLEKQTASPEKDLTEQGARWYRLATLPRNQSDRELAVQIEKHLVSRVYSQVDPGAIVDKVKCPVFLIHGAYDDLIPPVESRELHSRLHDSRLLVLPFITHTHPINRPIPAGQKVKSVLESLVFFYQFSQVIL